MTQEEVVLKLGVSNVSLRAGLHEAGSAITGFASEMRHHLLASFGGVASIAGLEEITRKSIEYGEKVYDLSRRLGISTDAVQVWDFALKKNSSSIEAATGFFEKLGTARGKALGGQEQMIAAFKQLGVTIDELKSKRVEDIAEKISDVFRNGGDPQSLIGALREVGGRSAGEMIPALTSGIAEARAEAEKMGLVLREDVVEELKRAADRAKQLKAEFTSWTAKWVADVVEGFSFLVDGFTAFTKAVREFFKNGFIDGFRHSKEASDRFNESMRKSVEENIERDKALRRQQSQGSGTFDETEAENAKRTQEEAAELSRKNQRGELTQAEQITELYKRRYELIDKISQAGLSAQEKAKLSLDIEKNRAEILQKEKSLTTETRDLNKEISTVRERIRFEETRAEQRRYSPFQPSIKELAEGGWWFRNRFFRSPFQQDAQRIEFLEQDAKLAFFRGNVDYAKGDIQEADRLRKGLQSLGVTSPDQRLESIDEAVKSSNEHLKTLLDKASRDGINVIPVEGA